MHKESKNNFSQRINDYLEEKALSPIFTAIDYHNNFIYAGFSSLSGAYWFGGLIIFRLNSSIDNLLGHIQHEDELMLVDDITPQMITHTTFDASVAAVARLNRYSDSNAAVVVGLDDGSLQLVTVRGSNENLDSIYSSMKPITIDSALYHDWPLEKLITMKMLDKEMSSILSLDAAGFVKSWDLNRLFPTQSWSTKSWNCMPSHQSLTPDICLMDTSPFIICTLNPLDFKQIKIWDLRLEALSGPVLNYSHSCANLTNDDLPTAINCLSNTNLLVGTYQGNLITFDIRQFNEKFQNIKAFNADEIKPIGNCDLIKSKQAQQPFVEASELNANDVQVTLIMQGLRAPRRGLMGIFKSGCSGQFHGDCGSSATASIREQLANGLLKVELRENNLSCLCELTNPNNTYEYHVRQLPSKIVPTFCSFKVRDNKVLLRLRKATGSDPWAGALAVKGLDQC